jgi:putative N6-adenine-specific DNA methylase
MSNKNLNTSTCHIIATCSMGLEKIVSDELKAIGIKQTTVNNGNVEFEGQAIDICRANLWLRSADRVLLKVGRFKATSFDELFEKTQNLDWASYIDEDGKFPLSHATSVKSTLFSKKDCQSISKKAVVKSLQKSYKTNDLPETGNSYPIRISILKDEVTLTIDTSGTGLHKRGYRQDSLKAPLRENLAAALILLSRWRGGDRVFLDPMCGSGTFLIEAAMIAKNIAPGLNRDFVSMTWPWIGKSTWQSAIDQANDLAKHDEKPIILGSDYNWKALQTCRENIAASGMDNIFVQNMPISEIRSKHKNGIILTNPPYGERLDDKLQAEIIYKELGEVAKERFTQWSYYIITSAESFESHFGRLASKKRKVYNGGIKCWYYQYFGKNFNKSD